MIAYNLNRRPLPHGRRSIDRHTMEVAVALVDDTNALKWLLKERAAEYPDLCHRTLMQTLDLLKK